MAAWVPCGYGYYIFPNQVPTQVNTTQPPRDPDASKIELPGGGFITRPGSDSMPSPMVQSNAGGGFITRPGSDSLPSPMVQLNVFATPAGEFITRPGSDSMPSPMVQLDAFATPEERGKLMNELDKLLQDRATREKTLQDMVTEEDSLRKGLNQVNEALDAHASELHQLTETMRTNRLEMQARIQEKKKRLEELKEDFVCVEKEEEQNAGNRPIANKSRYFKRQIAKQKDEKKVLEKKVDDLLEKKKMLDIRCKMMVDEEQTLWLRISEKVQWMVKNGHRIDMGLHPETISEIKANKTSIKDAQPQASTSSSPTKPTDRQVRNKDEIDAAGRTECAQSVQMELPVGDLKKSGGNSAQLVETCVETANPQNGSCSELKADNTIIKDEQSQTRPSSDLSKPTDSEVSDREETDASESKECGIVYCNTLLMEAQEDDSADSSATSMSSTQSVATCVEVVRPETGRESKEENVDTKDDQTQTSPSYEKLTDSEASNREDTDAAERKHWTKGIIYSDSLQYELPGGVWTESSSINSTSTAESLAIAKTEITVKVDVHKPPKSPKTRNQFPKKLTSHSRPPHLTRSQEQLAVKIESIGFEEEDQAVEESHKKEGIFGCFKVLRRFFKLSKKLRGNQRKSARKL